MDRREFLGATAGIGVALAYPADILGSNLPSDLTRLSASQLSAAIRQRHVSCVEVMRAYLQRIHRYNPVYNAIVSMVDDDTLLAWAVLADEALRKDQYWGWMHGMPHAVKDLSDAAGLPTSQGSPIFADTRAEQDDYMISRIRNEGAIFIGKTNTPANFAGLNEPGAGSSSRSESGWAGLYPEMLYNSRTVSSQLRPNGPPVAIF